MMLCDTHVADMVAAGRLGVDPFDPAMLQPASLDVRLGDTFLRDGMFIHPVMGIPGNQSVVLEPGIFMLAHTLETVNLPSDLAARVEGKSSWGRRGLLVHLTAGFVDPGFEGQITLELKNLSNQQLRLMIGEPIAQLSFHQLSGPAGRPYGSPGLRSHYQGQRGATPAR